MDTDGILRHMLFKYRWVFVIIFLLPCTVLYNIYFHVKQWIEELRKPEPKDHHEKVHYVQHQVKEWIKSSQDIPMCTSRPGWKAMTLREPKYKKIMYNIAVDLDSILEINTDRQIVKVEPSVTMGQLSAVIIPKGWTLPVFVELNDLTIGGMIMGTGIETSSHIYGLFQHICVSFELVLADGSVTTCSKENNPDLFYSVPWSYGTLGFLTAVDLKIIPAKRYVKLEYQPVYSLDEAVKTFEQEMKCLSGNLFVEGIMFTLNRGVIMTGDMVDSAEQVNAIGRWYKPWFFEHVRTFLYKGKGVDYIPLRDYYHRHTKSLFWELQDIVPFGNNPAFRWLLGWTMPPKISFLKLTQTKTIKELYDKHHVVQDFLVPLAVMKESLLTFEEMINVYPVWLCPFKLPSEPGLVHSFSDKTELYVDIGLYGTPHSKNYDSVETTKKMEDYVKEVKGYQMLYAGTYASEVEFRQMFDHSLYDRVRDRLRCNKAFPIVYDKVNRKVRD